MIARLRDVIAKDKRRIIGLMSGMSMDGVDLACVDIGGTFPSLTVDLLGTHYRPYTPEFASSLRNARHGTTKDVSVLNVLVAEEFAACVEEFFHQGDIARSSVDAIGSHGQTIYHSTAPDVECPSSLQIGSLSVIAHLTGVLTVGNFRTRDIAAGGQGAPLVPLADYVLFRDPGATIACNNLGSISNVTVVTPQIENMFAFDTGPANMAIDYFARLMPGNQEGIDKNGIYSSRGQCIQPLLERLLANPFFSRPPPKAAGYDEFGAKALDVMASDFLSGRPEDLIRTAVEFATVTLTDAYRKFVLPKHPDLRRVVLSGGGVHNTTLVTRIRDSLGDLTVEVVSKRLADAKEAMAFAILANEMLSGRSGNIPKVSGARHSVPLGEIAL